MRLVKTIIGVLAELRGLNHLLQTAPTGSPAEYQEIAETMSPTALDAISAWIVDQLRQPRERHQNGTVE